MSRGFPSMTALLGLLAVAGYQNRDKIAEWLRGDGQQSTRELVVQLRLEPRAAVYPASWNSFERTSSVRRRAVFWGAGLPNSSTALNRAAMVKPQNLG